MSCGCKKLKASVPSEKPMSLTMLDRNTEPNGGYRFSQIIGDRKHTFTSPTLEQLTELVKKYRLANNIPVISDAALMMEIEDQLCKVSPPGTCRDVKGQVITTGRTLTIEDVKRGTQTLVDWFLNGREKAPKETMEARAKICATCYANVEPSGCTSCAAATLRALAEKITGGEELAYDQHIKSCFYCGCQLRALVRLPIDLIRKHTPPAEFESLPEHCWKLKENYG